jgi:hypothetical protein
MTTRMRLSHSRQRRPEQQLQRAVIDHLRWRAPADVWFAHYPAGGQRSPIEAAILKGMGVRPGTPDLLLLKDWSSRASAVGSHLNRSSVIAR